MSPISTGAKAPCIFVPLMFFRGFKKPKRYGWMLGRMKTGKRNGYLHCRVAFQMLSCKGWGGTGKRKPPRDMLEELTCQNTTNQGVATQKTLFTRDDGNL